MAQIIQLTFDWGRATASPMGDDLSVEETYFGQPFEDICKRCDLRELCSSDDCGKKLYDIDLPELQDYLQTFEDWLLDPIQI